MFLRNDRMQPNYSFFVKLASNPAKEDVGYQYSSSVKVHCDMFQKTNTTRHHTEEYVNSSLVLRRGDFVMLGMTFEGIDLSEVLNVKLRLSMGE